MTSCIHIRILLWHVLGPISFLWDLSSQNREPLSAHCISDIIFKLVILSKLVNILLLFYFFKWKTEVILFFFFPLKLVQM